ncbi:unnamed protein product [Rotaria magnacalcarata]|uniref:C3H1-type domain-containing protein n=2 Tax=Rotaria magnacalcarata TaxID=392030 RepID=A0A819H480_9BILA|nr:unnamed protein product [Rotaria magnacalcarata]CAF3889777.1 unnamed protein product [Rotaria magnacalcarata]
MSTTSTNSVSNDQSSIFDLHNESSLSSCSSSPPTSAKTIHNTNENDSGCASDDDPTLALKINKGLSMGYDYELIKSVIQQQNNSDDMSKFIETIVRTAEVNGNSTPTTTPTPSALSSSKISTATNSDTDSSDTSIPHDVYIIDGIDLAYSYNNNNNNNSFSWRGIEICLKYLHTHGHKKVFVVLPYSLKHHRHDQNFSESKSLRDLERKNLLVYTNRMSKQTNKPSSYTHISEMLKFAQKIKGHLITNVSLKDVILDFTIYKQILEEKVIRYRFQNDNFQPLLVTIVNDDDGNDCETHFPLCPYGKKCTYGNKCKYFHIERRHQNQFSVSENLQMKARLEKTKIQHHLSTPAMMTNNGFHLTNSSPDHLHMYSSPMMEQNLADDARMAYEYGLTSTPISNEFSFVDQRVSPIRQTPQNWFTTPNQQYPYMNRSFSMPQQQPTNELSAAMFMHQQNWARQQMFPMQQQQQQQPQQIEQNVLRFLSMLSLQQRNNVISNNNLMTSHMQQQQQQQENPYDQSSIDSQQGLADKIQAVRHLWEAENKSTNSPSFAHVQQQIPPVTDSNIYNPMTSTFQQSTQNFLHYN